MKKICISLDLTQQTLLVGEDHVATQKNWPYPLMILSCAHPHSWLVGFNIFTEFFLFHFYVSGILVHKFLFAS